MSTVLEKAIDNMIESEVKVWKLIRKKKNYNRECDCGVDGDDVDSVSMRHEYIANRTVTICCVCGGYLCD